MKKKLLIIICLILLCSIIYSVGQKDAEKNLPKNVKVIGITGVAYGYIMTVIDLDNNEIMLLSYYFTMKEMKLFSVQRTGLIVNPKDYTTIAQSSAPFPQENN
jgi:hypothetical protein